MTREQKPTPHELRMVHQRQATRYATKAIDNLYDRLLDTASDDVILHLYHCPDDDRLIKYWINRLVLDSVSNMPRDLRERVVITRRTAADYQEVNHEAL